MKTSTYLLIAIVCFAVSCSKQKPVGKNDTAVTADTSGTSYNNHGSIYDMDMPFTDQNGKPVGWTSLKGKVRIMAMFFSHCPAACPIITEDIKKAEALLPEAARDSIGITMISFDSKRDTSARLMEFYRAHNLNPRWELLHGASDDVRMIANLLNVDYKEWPSGDFTHQNLIFVVDCSGRIALRREGLGKDPHELSEKVLALLYTSNSCCAPTPARVADGLSAAR